MTKMTRTHKFVATLCFSFIGRLVVVSALVGPTPGIASPVNDSRSYYIGILGRVAVQMDLRVSAGDISGTYYYERVGKPLGLRGNISQDGKVTINEVDEKGQKTGTFRGQFAKSQEKFEGTWSSADQKTHFPFQLSKVAEYLSRQATKERCWSTESPDKKEQGDCSLSFEYPRFLSSSPGVRQINTVIEKRIADENNEFSKRQEEKDEKTINVDKGEEWFNKYTYDVAFYGEELISLVVADYWYAGGAHSNTNYESANFSITGGKAVSLKLSDLFLPQATYIDLLSAYCINDLRKQGAAHVTSGHVQELDEDHLSVFSILPSGIEFSFRPYVVGPYPDGSYFVTVPYDALRKITNPKGPLRRFVASIPASDRQQGDR
jgi:Deacetylase PdaC/Protein of unknown function (DUF3298)